MSKHIENKKLIMEYNKSIYGATVDTIDSIISKYYHDDIDWKGPQPFNEMTNKNDVVEKFYKPILKAMPNLSKEVDIHIAGNDPIFPERDWVMSSGNYVGTFENDLCHIPATNNAIWIRYLEFNQVTNGKISHTYTIIDMLDLMRQAGIKFVKALAPETIIPGPFSHDGIVMGESDTKESEKTFKLIYDMCWQGLDSFEDNGLGKMGLDRYMHKDFYWYGPCGIGTTRGFKCFEEQHQNPFLKAVPDRKSPERGVDFNDNAYIADGKYCGFIFWTEFYATHTGNDWLGMPATGKKIIMRDADIYRCEDGLIVENWCQMDVIDVLLQMGVDIFDRLKRKIYVINC